MSGLRQIDFLLIDDIFEMNNGYVLNFSDRTFAQFFKDELNIDIDANEFSQNGTSKAKRLRSFLRSANNDLVVRVLNALWEYRQAVAASSRRDETVPNAQDRLIQLVGRLGGDGTSGQPQNLIRPEFNWSTVIPLKSQLTEMIKFTPQERGYKFESYLKALFNCFGLKAHEGFRNRGEQIDGSFELNSHIYLLEAKWQNVLTGAADLHIFQGKLDQKADWARGIFVSYSGFSPDGLLAFGRGKKVICMDGRDIFEALDRQIPLNQIIEQKGRRAVETGNPFIPVSEL
jgi:hypothetical protein